jgi:Mce-associated membrane protein
VEVVVARSLEQVRQRLTGRGPLLGLLAALSVASIVGALLLAPKLATASDEATRRDAILHAARQQAVNFTTLDYRHLDRDLGRVLEGSTGEFRKQFRAGTLDLTKLVSANKAVAQGEVLEAGIVSDDSDSARALVVADSTVTNTGSPKPDKRHYRIQLDLVRDPAVKGGRWLVSDLTFVG